MSFFSSTRYMKGARRYTRRGRPWNGRKWLAKRAQSYLGQTNLYVRLTLASYCRVHVTFIDKEGLESTFAVAEGDNLLDIAQSEDIDMEGTYLWVLVLAACYRSEIAKYFSQGRAVDHAPVRPVMSLSSRAKCTRGFRSQTMMKMICSTWHLD